MRKILGVVLILLTCVVNSYAKQLSPEEIKKEIYQLDLLEVHIRICNISDKFCRYSSFLLRDFSPHLHKMFYSIVKHESARFSARKGKHDPHDYGLVQVNVKTFPIKILREKFGFVEIYYPYQLVKDDRLALRVGFTILWYNIVSAYMHGVRYRTIYEYVQCYHRPYKPTKYYWRRVKAHIYESYRSW